MKLDEEEVDLLDDFCRGSRNYDADDNLVQEGSNPGCVFIVLSGLAYRSKLLPGGHRQILGYLIPGDICDLSFAIAGRADHNVTVLVPSRIAKLPLQKFIDAVGSSPNVTRGLQLSAHLDMVIMREWLLNAGQSKAPQKLSHFLCEMAARLNRVGKISADGWFDFPVNQVMLADTVGLSTVHINRTLQRLRNDGVILLDRRRLNILDMARLCAIANFEGNYLNSLDLPV
ncbi:MAG: Crp/Fnr family transcriptional regulator [Sphingomicrobium sp.]